MALPQATKSLAFPISGRANLPVLVSQAMRLAVKQALDSVP